MDGIQLTIGHISGRHIGIETEPNPAQPTNALLNRYRTRDERWILLTILHQSKHWPNLLEALARTDLLTDPRFINVKQR